jgi:hypothetical protein
MLRPLMMPVVAMRKFRPERTVSVRCETAPEKIPTFVLFAHPAQRSYLRVGAAAQEEDNGGRRPLAGVHWGVASRKSQRPEMGYRKKTLTESGDGRVRAAR